MQNINNWLSTNCLWVVFGLAVSVHSQLGWFAAAIVIIVWVRIEIIHRNMWNVVAHFERRERERVVDESA